MIKPVALTLLLNTLLFAKTVSQSEQNSILLEAVLFIVVFGTMGLISYIYSNRHAKAYKPKKVEARLEVEQTPYEKRISELEEMLKNKMLTQEEFEILNNHYLKAIA